MTRKHEPEHRDEDQPATTEELVAAYADQGLDAAEHEAVQAHLAEHPEARAEVDGMRSMLDELRASPEAPEGAPEPDWNAMAARITTALRSERDQMEAMSSAEAQIHTEIHTEARAEARAEARTVTARTERESSGPGPGQWLRALFARIGRPRYVVGGLALAGAAAIVLYVVMRDQGPRQDDVAENEDPALESRDQMEQDPPAPPDMTALSDEDAELLDDLERALDEALDDMAESDSVAVSDDEPDGPGASDEALDDSLDRALEALDGLESDGDALLADLLAESSAAGDGTTDVDAVFDTDDENWLEELSDEELDELGRLLGQTGAG